MGLKGSLLRWATSRPHVYLVEAPGAAYVRRAAEAALDARGWRRADSPAQADVLLTAGDDAAIAGHLDLVWSQLPGPRVRHQVVDAAAVDAALDEVARRLRDAGQHAADARSREDEVARWLEDDSDAEQMDHGDHGDHGGHDHGGGMAPSGIPLADGADDRDGLEMDRLVHTLGPALSLWPGGLVVRLTLAGDVVAEVEHRWLGDVVSPAPADPAHSAGTHWDAVATTLALAGDEHAATLARHLRDRPDDATHAAARRLRRHVARLHRLRALPSPVAAALLAEPGAEAGAVDVADLVRGRDLADARLLIASHLPRIPRTPGTPGHSAHHAGHEGMSHG